MKFKVGDKVKFLNENGGGVVSKILSSNMVNVSIGDGFEIPTLTTDIIKTGLPDDPGNFFEESFDVEIKTEIINDNEPEVSTRISPIQKYNSLKAAQPGIYLAFVPQDQKWLITGFLDIFLINNSDYDALFSFYLKSSDKKLYTGIDYNVVPPRSKMLIETIERDNIEKWSGGVIQVLFHKDESELVLLPVNSEYKIKPTRFYKEINYKDSSLLAEKSLMLTISEIAELIPHDNTGNQDIKEENNIINTKSKENNGNDIIEKHRVKGKKPSSFFKIAEVDLHIEELIDDHSKMNTDEILNYQISYFTKCLESAINNRYSKIIFIHGIGNGTLKTLIISKLQEYEYIRYDDAILSRYGKGAIEVKIFYSK